MKDQPLPLTAHLRELRSRIFRILLAWVAASTAAWNWREEIFGRLLAPATHALGEHAKLQAIANIDAAINLSTRPRMLLGDLFRVLQKAYEDNGHGDQWKLHHQGGPTGYANREAVATPDSTLATRDNQAFAWNPSIVGIKSEDTVLCTDQGVEVLTAHSEEWPTVVGRFDGKELARADVLVR